MPLPKDDHILPLKPVNMLPYMEEKDFADVIRDLEMGIYSRLSKWAQYNHKALIKRRQKGQSQRRKCDKKAAEIAVMPGRVHRQSNTGSLQKVEMQRNRFFPKTSRRTQSS